MEKLSKTDPLSQKSKAFALRIINLFTYLTNKKEFVISKQILRSGTSIGANIVESKGAVSGPDFANKLSIALKECLETEYWLDLLFEADFIEERLYKSFMNDILPIGKMLRKSIKTTRT
ncbi:MAG TPA: four helix bundle protein [Candidatus Gracilibacteria bacterium]